MSSKKEKETESKSVAPAKCKDGKKPKSKKEAENKDRLEKFRVEEGIKSMNKMTKNVLKDLGIEESAFSDMRNKVTAYAEREQVLTRSAGLAAILMVAGTKTLKHPPPIAEIPVAAAYREGCL